MRMVARLAFAAGLMLVGLVLRTETARSATISPNVFVDEPLSDPDNGNCTLREAIWSAITDSSNDQCLAGSGTDTVFIPAGIYTLTAGEILLSTDLTIDGEPGTIIDGGNTSNIFRRTGLLSTVTIQDLTLRNGASAGGSCFSQGSSYTTTLSNVTMTNCIATERGGAIYSGGDLIIIDSTFENNSATGNPGGNNSGGAIYTGGVLTITRSVFRNNSVDLSASPGQGGAIHYIGSSLIIEDSTFDNNQAVTGGAIFGSNSVISGSTFNGNSASSSGGAILGSSTVTNSTFSGNAKGAIKSSGTTTITNSTFYDNTGAASLVRQGGTFTIKNTLLFSFSGGLNCSNTITSAGYNLDNNSTCSLGGTGDISGVNPLLGALALNSGATKTHALLTGSQAIDAGTNTGCPTDDQRGLSRPQDGDEDSTATCDIGAYELVGPTFTDVGSSHWAFGYIEAIAEAGLTVGYPDGTYRPTNQVTRAEMAVFLLVAKHGSGYAPPAADGSHPFSDIVGHWAEAWIEQLYDEGMTVGYPDGTYRPGNQVTRAEMAVLLLVAKNGSGYTPPAANGSHPFSDIAGHWANAWIEQLYDEGITAGYPDGTFRPDNPVTRAEMAVFLVATFGLTIY
jgi:CSLREA domain-containing protein